MSIGVERHYGGTADLAGVVRGRLAAAGKDLERLSSADLAAVDEFHIRGRQATLELAGRMGLDRESHVLDLGSGLGGPARTLAEAHGCRVTGIDLTRSFCEAATAMSGWLGLSGRVRFVQGEATRPPFPPASFDAAMTIHVAMNIAAKDALYAAAMRALKPGRIFAVYDVLQGEGGPVVFPVPWAREPAISHLATPAQMRELLSGAGFEILEEIDSTEAGLAWFREKAAALAGTAPPPLGFQLFLGDDYARMTRNQVQNLAEKRIRTVAYVCRSSERR
ncbi:MAG: SAM-dependent methyltransferase [Burkholderiales bacterium]|nr:SAM-dependent methyltransferase [Burkholderiales bacterium]